MYQAGTYIGCINATLRHKEMMLDWKYASLSISPSCICSCYRNM